ncbi:MAG: hypothetical protein M5U19_01300 [Microthrixaceae bacterium]|nr:hypothetical protein [Microthrixaceae bacterium]
MILSGGGFAADTAPPDALIAVPGPDGDWVVGENVVEARAAAGKVQGRRTTTEPKPPLTVPDGDWAAVLATSWVEPAYLETDASWCFPGGEPAGVLANGGAFGAKSDSPLPEVARRLADLHGRSVLALWSREDTVNHGPKRPPVALGIDSSGAGGDASGPGGWDPRRGGPGCAGAERAGGGGERTSHERRDPVRGVGGGALRPRCGGRRHACGWT